MKQLGEIAPVLADQSKDTRHPEMLSELPAPNLRPDYTPPSPHVRAAAKAVDRLFDLLPPLDVGDPKAFIAAAATIFAAYPPEVWDAVNDPVRGITGKAARPALADIKKACDLAYEPIERDMERAQARRDYLRGLLPPRAQRTPEEQARVDAQVEETRRIFGVPQPKAWVEPPARGDGKHFERIKKDLEARRARNEATEPGASVSDCNHS